MFKRIIKLNIIPVIIIKSYSYRPKQNDGWMCKHPRVTVLVSTKSHNPMYLLTSNLKSLLKEPTQNFQDYILYENVQHLFGLILGSVKTERNACLQCPLKSRVSSWDDCTCPRTQAHRRDSEQELNQVPGTTIISLHQNAFAERVLIAKLPHLTLSQSLFACSFCLCEAKQSPRPLCLCPVGAEPEHCLDWEERHECLWLLQAQGLG